MDNKNILTNVLISAIATGIWAIVLQNFGIISTGKKTVSVDGKVQVNGMVNANVSNTVDVNIGAINGKRNVFYDQNHDGNYHRIPVYTGN